MGRTEKILNQDNLLSWANKTGQEMVTQALSHRLVKDVTCIDPSNETIFSLPSMKSSSLSQSQYLQHKVIWARSLVSIERCIRIKAIPEVIIKGGNPDELVDLATIYKEMRDSLEAADLLHANLIVPYYIRALQPFVENETLLQMNTRIPYSPKPLAKILYFVNEKNHFNQVYFVLAIEGNADLVNFFLKHAQGWTAKIEVEMVFVASYFGHSHIVDIFLNDTYQKFHSPPLDRHYHAMLGATAAKRLSDLRQLSEEINLSSLNDFDPLKDPTKSYDYNDAEGILGLYTYDDVMHSFELVLLEVGYYEHEGVDAILKIISLFNLLVKDYNLKPVQHQRRLHVLIQQIVEFITRKSSGFNIPDEFYSLFVELLESLIVSVDLQDIIVEYVFTKDNKVKEFVDNLSSLKEKQRRYWAQFDVVKKGGLLEDVKHSISCGNCFLILFHVRVYFPHLRLILYLDVIHPIQASYDRLDVLKWLVSEKGIDLDTPDGVCRMPQQIAEAAKAKSTIAWILEYKAGKLITHVISSHMQRITAIHKHRSIVRNVIFIQRLLRGHLTRKLYRGALCLRLEESQQFNDTWAPSIRLLPQEASRISGWKAVRSRTCDISTTDVDADQYTADKLDKALSKVVLQDEESFDEQIENEKEPEPYPGLAKDDVSTEVKWSNMFLVTSHVVKFLKAGDPLYRSFFVRRMKQLANGDRSRILQKRLKGSQSAIFETYLEQKSGFRILWTEEADTIVVWFVAKHKSVSRLIRLIDDAKSRSARQKLPEALVKEKGQRPAAENILLDVGNAPLKVYDLNFHQLDNVTKASWTPQLHLTEEERSVVEAEGTVLLLGRSG
eukprot:scaffold373608_cov103-Cyclotella_meneghiniana.AAC.3